MILRYLKTIFFLAKRYWVDASWYKGTVVTIVPHPPTTSTTSSTSTPQGGFLLLEINKEIIKIRLRRHKRASRADDPAWLTNERGD
jgi:hypothetical protein